MKQIFTDLKLIVYIAIPIILLYLYKTRSVSKENTTNVEEKQSSMYVSNYGNSIYYDNKLNQISKIKAPVSKEIKSIMKNISSVTNNPQVIFEINQIMNVNFSKT